MLLCGVLKERWGSDRTKIGMDISKNNFFDKKKNLIFKILKGVGFSIVFRIAERSKKFLRKCCKKFQNNFFKKIPVEKILTLLNLRAFLPKIKAWKLLILLQIPLTTIVTAVIKLGIFF
jgi:hypothetical protein